jgi:hypothetical protein
VLEFVELFPEPALLGGDSLREVDAQADVQITSASHPNAGRPLPRKRSTASGAVPGGTLTITKGFAGVASDHPLFFGLRQPRQRHHRTTGRAL